jgi:hypothetical protein
MNLHDDDGDDILTYINDDDDPKLLLIFITYEMLNLQMYIIADVEKKIVPVMMISDTTPTYRTRMDMLNFVFSNRTFKSRFTTCIAPTHHFNRLLISQHLDYTNVTKLPYLQN